MLDLVGAAGAQLQNGCDVLCDTGHSHDFAKCSGWLSELWVPWPKPCNVN